MSQHQDHPHLDKVKTHFISGEPGTTGREPFEDSLGLGAGNQHGNVGAGQSSGLTGSSHTGTGLTGSSGTHTGTGLTESSGTHTGTGLTGSSGTHTGSGLTGSSGNRSGSGLTGSDGDYSTGAGTGLTGAGHQQHNSNAGTAAGAGAVGIAGHGLTGLSHPGHDDAAHGHSGGHIGSSPANTDKDNRGIVEKVKDALPGGNSSNTTSHSSTTHNSSTHNNISSTHNSHSTTGTGAYPASGTGTGEKRDVVDKINDALPGTPAKTEQHYGTSHNPTTVGDRTVGSGTEYGAGHHGTSGAPRTGVAAGVGAGAAAAATHHHSSTSDNHSSSLGGGGLTGATGGHREHGDRVGAAGQESSKYEGDRSSGPRTSGAAGTERFDSSHTGAPGNVGAGLDRQHDDGVHHDTSQRAPGKSSGGIGGLLATSDKDFTGRERQGKGAYADTDGLYKLNSTGPAGNTALTGREGDLSKNPVAQSQTRDGATPGHNVHATDATGAHGEAAHGEKKGLLAKVKDALGA